ncbi:MAG: hypothetical protein WCX46_04270 [Candidatus Paceibacterota bacterium]
MTINKRRHYYKPAQKLTLLDHLDEKSLNVLRSFGLNLEELRDKKIAHEKIPNILEKIKRNFNDLDQKTIEEIKTMCYVGKNPNNYQIIIRPFNKKIIDLYKYVNNHPSFRSSN